MDLESVSGGTKSQDSGETYPGALLPGPSVGRAASVEFAAPGQHSLLTNLSQGGEESRILDRIADNRSKDAPQHIPQGGQVSGPC